MNTTFRLTTCLILAWLLLSASGLAQTRPRVVNEQTRREQNDPLSREPSYRIRKGDKLSVRFLYQPELNDALLVVRPDGRISLQLVDEIKAEGLTLKELKAALERAYREILVEPEISVSLVEFVPLRVFVGGQVQKPGSYELRSGETVLQAVILAGGFTNEAHRRLVLHARPVGDRELKVEAVDVLQLLKPGSNVREVILQDGDYVFVPNSKLSKFARIIDAFRTLVPGYGIRY
ncbi:MAG: polysaccharide biosynthesis/export family protein [Blastocatellia bacterium]